MKTGIETLGQRITGTSLALLTGAVLVFLVAPILIIVPLSFSSGSFFHYPLPGFSLRWYDDFFASSFWSFQIFHSPASGCLGSFLLYFQSYAGT